MRRCSLQVKDPFHFVVYLRDCADGCTLEGRFLSSFLSRIFKCFVLLLHSQGLNGCAGKGIKKCNKMLRNPPGMLRLGALEIVIQGSLDSPEDWSFLMKKIGSRFIKKQK